MTAETDIAALTDGGANPISEIRTALTSTLARADLWKSAAARMSLTSSQTLSTSTENVIAFDREEFDTDGDLVELANDRFVIQDTGIYLVEATWIWEAQPPANTSYISLKKNGSDFTTIERLQGGAAGGGTLSCARIASLTAGDLITMTCNPQANSSVTARGNASVQISTGFAVARIG